MEGQEPGSPEGELVTGVERPLAVNEDVDGLLHRHALHAQRSAARGVDAVVARFPESPAVGDERE